MGGGIRGSAPPPPTFPAARDPCPGAPGLYVTGAGSLRRGAGGRRRAGFPAAGRLNTAAASLSSSSSASSRSPQLGVAPPAGLGSPALRWAGGLPPRSAAPQLERPALPCERVAPCWEGWKVTRRKLFAGIAPCRTGLVLVSFSAALGWTQPLFVEFCIYLWSKRYHSGDILIGSSLSSKRSSDLEP